MKIALLGYGVVGKGVEMLVNSHPEYNISVEKILMMYPEWCTQENMTADFSDIINNTEIDTVVECIGGLEPAHSYAAASLASGKNFISSNKKMVAQFYSELAQLAIENHVSLRFSSACGGGIPWLEQVNSIKQREEIYDYRGIMNGTSNYILDKMASENMDFSEALSKAQQLGYAEADPSDDIDGVDTANKTVLSANVAYDGIFDVHDMLIKGIRYISAKENQYAADNGYKCVLRGVGKKKEGQVGIAVYPCFVKRNQVLGSIVANFNCFILNSANLGELSFVGQGAGRFPTASNVVADLLKVRDNQPFIIKGETKVNCDAILVDDFYIRTVDSKPFEGCEMVKIDEESFIIKKVSVKDLREMLKNCQDEKIFIAGVEND